MDPERQGNPDRSGCQGNPDSLCPMNPKGLLTPTLSSFWGGEGDGVVVLLAIQGFNARNWLRGILTPAFSLAKALHLFHRSSGIAFRRNGKTYGNVLVATPYLSMQSNPKKTENRPVLTLFSAVGRGCVEA